MTTITIGQVKENRIITVAKQVFASIQSFQKNSTTSPKPAFLDPEEFMKMGLTMEEVEEKMRQPAWRYIGRMV